MEFVWRKIDHIHELKKARCRHIYALKDKSKDVALIFSGKTFYAMEAWCGHMGNLNTAYSLIKIRVELIYLDI